MRSVFALVLVVLAACGRVGFEPRGDGAAGAVDAAVDAAGAMDAPLGAFGAPTLIGELADPNEDDDPTLTGDLLEMYYASYRAGGMGQSDIFRSVRTSVDEPWQTPTPVVELNSTVVDESPGITLDGLEMFFTSGRGGNDDIYTSTRATRADMWSQPVRVSELSTSGGDFQAQPSATELRLVMYRAQSGNRDVYEATRTQVGATWAAPQPLTPLNMATSGERSPCLSASELEIIFSSDRAAATDVQNLYHAVRPSVTEPFGAPMYMTELNTAADEDDAWLSPDGRVLFLSSNRSGNTEIYEARR